MIDPFVLSAPVLLLGVIALLRFAGCFTEPGPPGPTPILDSISPNMVTARPDDVTPTSIAPDDISGVTLAANGRYYGNYGDQYSQLIFNGQALPSPSFTDANGYSMSAALSAADIKAAAEGLAGSASVYVNNHFPPEGDFPSAMKTFTISVTVTLDNTGFASRTPLNGVFRTQDFGNGSWMWVSAATDVFSGVTYNLVGPGPGSASIGFANGPRVLTSLIVIPKSAGTISIIDSRWP